MGSIPGTGWEEKYLDGDELAEARLIRRMAEAMNVRQARLRKRERASRIRRGFQAKSHAGIGNARFAVSLDVPDELRRGIFQPGATYAAAVRLSNAAGTIQHDPPSSAQSRKGARTIPDVQGLAVRVYSESAAEPAGEDLRDPGAAVDYVLGLKGGEVIQDFLATSSPVSHTADAREFLIFANADVCRSNVGKFISMFIHSPALARRARRSFLAYLRRPVDSLACQTYWSRAPFAVDRVAVKFRLRPERASNASIVDRSGFNRLREELVDRLGREDVRFKFEIQRFKDAAATPIEDATVEWRSDWEELGELVIPRQDLTGATGLRAQLRVDEMEFNPWHSTGENDFRPLGSLNRARRLVYDASADLRKGRRSQDTVPRYMEVLIRVLGAGFSLVDRIVPWGRWPRSWWSVTLTALSAIRERGRERNLHDVPLRFPGRGIRTHQRCFDPGATKARDAAGRYNDPTDPDMGSAGSVFARNIPLSAAIPHGALLDPSPREVSRLLMTREPGGMNPIPHLNLFAVAWIQFQVHGWFNHERVRLARAADPELVRIKLNRPDDTWPESIEDAPAFMTIARTPRCAERRVGDELLPVYANTETSWWDGSQLYGSSLRRQLELRETRPTDGGSQPGCRLRLEGRRLPEDEATRGERGRGVDLTGFNDNYWLGLSLMHTLFASEHNAICAALADEYPALSQEELFQKGRLINAALMAKLHTLEWTPAVLDKPVVGTAFDAYWWGLAGQDVSGLLKSLAPREVMHGLPGARAAHHGVPYAMTEEFVSVYRMHPLLPDEFEFVDLNGDPAGHLGLADVTGERLRETLDELGLDTAMYTFGLRNPGKITLFNYPRALQEHRRIRKKNEPEEIVDVAAVDIFRDRERGIPRYNEFRRLLGLPRAKSFLEMANGNESWARRIADVYPGGVDTVDAMVGMFAETPPHEGFGFSETAFRVFLVMAARRQLSDRFLTTHFTPEVYTPLGMEWIRGNTLKSVMLRHHPELRPALGGVDRIFRPWDRQ